MSDTSSPFGFELVRRGYDRGQVDDRITKLVADRDSALARITALEKRIEELHLETQNAQAQVSDAEPSYAGLGARVEKILRLAEEEAKDLREEARRAAEQHRELAESAAQQVRNDAESFSAERKAKAEDEGVRIVEKAKGDASTLRSEAQKDAQSKREEADALFEETRAKAAQAAADFETNLAKRREQSERDLASRQAKAEKRLAEIEHRAEQLRLEAEKLRTDAERRARQTVETAQRQAEDIVADANAKADRIRSESERELAALTNRRDSINAQLTNVREMLATLTGAAVAAAGYAGRRRADLARRPGPAVPLDRAGTVAADRSPAGRVAWTAGYGRSTAPFAVTIVQAPRHSGGGGLCAPLGWPHDRGRGAHQAFRQQDRGRPSLLPGAGPVW